jgi:hypothetical protein
VTSPIFSPFFALGFIAVWRVCILWFAQDFINHAGSVKNFLQDFVSEDKKSTVEALSGGPQYLEYNWTLNAQDGQRIS